ncbi:Ashwin [Camelus dromedarius]|uniref:Ashwin n=1 Tax=Camelus dromedarius TaxID=9838 RepID=A0A5N4CDH3_CAMDR|nr:Ashwin [Camelus dromedarius]
MAGDVAGRGCADSELLLHPELLSQEFLLLTLEQKNIAVENDVRVNKDSLTDLYVQHAIPLPRRDLPKNRWGKMMEKKREQHETKNETKRKSPPGPVKSPPLSPVGTTPVKLKRAAAPREDAEAANSLKPPEAKRKIQHVTWP